VIAIARSMISLMLVGQHDRAEGLHALLTDDVLALIAHDASALGWFQRAQGHHALHRGDSAAYLAMMQASTVSFTRAGDLRTALAQRVNEGFAYVQLGRYDVAATLLRAVLVESTTLGARMILNGARNNLGIALAHLGQLEEARALEELAAGELLADGDRRLAAGSLVYLATIHRLAGALDLAERAARDALEPLVMRNSARVEALATLAEVLLAARRTDEALAFALEAMEIQASLGDRLESNAIAPLVCAEALDACGRREDALRVLLPARDRLLLRASKISSPALRASMLENVPSHARTLQLARDWSAV
jgi:tetratricopeptide (TPR) repeat protein